MAVASDVPNSSDAQKRQEIDNRWERAYHAKGFQRDVILTAAFTTTAIWYFQTGPHNSGVTLLMIVFGLVVLGRVVSVLEVTKPKKSSVKDQIRDILENKSSYSDKPAVYRPPSPVMNVGDKFEHGLYGRGTITRTIPGQHSTGLVIEFPTGKRAFVARHAPSFNNMGWDLEEVQKGQTQASDDDIRRSLANDL